VAIGGTNYGTLRQRQGTVASLAAANPVLSYGEFTMTYDGLDPVLKIGDGTRPWLELPNLVGSGGGGGGGTVTYRAAESWSSAALRVAGEGGIDEFGSTWGAPYDPDGAHDPSSWIEDNGTGGLLLAEGWYHVALSVNIVFPAATAVDYVRVGLNVGSSLAGNHQVVLAPASATDDRVTFSDLVNLGPIYSDGTTFVRPSIRWTNGFYAPDDAELGAHIIRVEPVEAGGGGGSGVLGAATAQAGAVAISAISGGQRAVFDNWAFTDTVGTVGGVGGAAEYGWGYEDEGWYQVTFSIDVGFTAGSDPLPEIVHLDWSSWDGDSISFDLPLTDPYGFPVTGGAGTLYGGKATVVTPIHHMPPAADVGGGELQSMNQVDLRWKGDAVLTRQNGGPALVALQLQVTRLSGV
jgi:hypothetical protein